MSRHRSQRAEMRVALEMDMVMDMDIVDLDMDMDTVRDLDMEMDMDTEMTAFTSLRLSHMLQVSGKQIPNTAV